MELGALICTPRQPQCLICPVRENCRAKNPESLPGKKPRRKTVELAENCAWSVTDGKLLLEQQTGSRWRGLWKLPPLTIEPSQSRLLLALEYPFTHHRVTLSVYLPPSLPKPQPAQQWVPLDEIDAVALAAPHRRAIKRLAQEFPTTLSTSPPSSVPPKSRRSASGK
jgi:A/G-specific adenine glycosylase